MRDVLGVDGDYVARSPLKIAVEYFEPADLNQPLRLNRSFDLALSLEAAEHLQPSRSESFVADLVRLAPAVLFSAAIPLQGGVDHVNERWQDEGQPYSQTMATARWISFAPGSGTTLS